MQTITEQALQLDADNGNSRSSDAINEEIRDAKDMKGLAPIIIQMTFISHFV